MKKNLASLVSGLSVVSLAIAFVSSFTSGELIFGAGESGDYILTLNESNGAITGSYSTDFQISVTARTASGNSFSVSYKNCMASGQTDYKYAQMRSSSGLLYSTYGVKGLKTVAVTFKNAGDSAPKIYFSSSTTFSSSSTLVSGTSHAATGDYFQVATGSNAIYIASIVLTYDCGRQAQPSSSSSSLAGSSSSSGNSSTAPSSSASSSSPITSSTSSYQGTYYSGIDWNTSGASLKTSLCGLINSHTSLGYDGLWTAYKTSDLDSNGKIWDMYSNYRWTPDSEKCGTYSVEGDCYNREHTIPQSVFSKANPMVCDLHHVYPTDGKVNGMRSNYPHGNVSSATYTSGNGSKLGTGSDVNYGYTGKVFEVIDEYKGDFARTYFYFVTCYQANMSGYTFDSFAKNTYPSLLEWALKVYLEWNDLDPVSAKEITRNDKVYSLQNNRNPFIDHPEAAHKIWDGAY